MTFSATLTVDDVSSGPAPIDVLASTETVTSNVEGQIKNIQVKFQLNEDETQIKIGDTVYVNGSITHSV